jgi:hypothetical protein
VPILDVELVCHSEVDFRAVEAGAVVEAAAKVFASPKGRTWVRLRCLRSECYAENESSLSVDELPVFVTVQLAQLPSEDVIEGQVLALTQAVARAVGREPSRVHVAYAPAGAGRQAFGGALVK